MPSCTEMLMITIAQNISVSSFDIIRFYNEILKCKIKLKLHKSQKIDQLWLNVKKIIDYMIDHNFIVDAA